MPRPPGSTRTAAAESPARSGRRLTGGDGEVIEVAYEKIPAYATSRSSRNLQPSQIGDDLTTLFACRA